MATIGDSPIKMNKDARAMIHLAFDDLGGVERLVNWANEPGNLGAFYTQIWAKIIPREVKAEHSGKDGGPIIISWANQVVEVPPPVDSPEDADLVGSEGGLLAIEDATLGDQDEQD